LVNLVPREPLVNKVYLDVMELLVLREKKVLLDLLVKLVPQVCLDQLVCPDKKARADPVEILAHLVHKDLLDLKVDVVQLAHKVCEEKREAAVNKETEVRKVIKVSEVSKVFLDPQERKVTLVFLVQLALLVSEEELDLVVLLETMVALVLLVQSVLQDPAVNLVLMV